MCYAVKEEPSLRRRGWRKLNSNEPRIGLGLRLADDLLGRSRLHLDAAESSMGARGK